MLLLLLMPAGFGQNTADSLNTAQKKKGFLGKAIKDITIAIEKASDDLEVKANLKLARMHENNQNIEKAIKKYELVLKELEQQESWIEVDELRTHLAELMAGEGDLPAALITLTEVREEREKHGDTAAVTVIQQKIDQVGKQMTVVATPQPPLPPKPANPADQEMARVEARLRNIQEVARQAENNQEYEKSLGYFKQYLEMEQTLAEQEKMQELSLLEKAHQIERQDQEITLLRQNEEINRLQLAQSQIELNRQIAFKRNLAGGLALSTMLMFSLFLMYRNKQKDHQKLGVAYRDLEATKDQLKGAEKQIKDLLTQQLSGAVANELLTKTGLQPVQRRFVCIMFLDIRDFTPYVEQLSPEDIIEYQNKVLGFMMEVVNRRQGIVNQILGDGFMATFGAPVSAGNDCEQAYLAAEEIIRIVEEKSEAGEIPPTRIGIGLHAGYVVAGNVGTKDRKQYSITGNPVIIAARLEQLNKEFSSTMVMSKEVYDHLPAQLQKPMAFNPVLVKGRSEPVEVAIC